MAYNNMRYKIELDGKVSNEGFVGLDDILCVNGYLVTPFHQSYVYEITYLNGYDVTLKPISDGAIAVHNDYLSKVIKLM